MEKYRNIYGAYGKFTNEELGIETAITLIGYGYAVSVKDTDADMFVSERVIFKNLEQAKDYAIKCTEGK